MAKSTNNSKRTRISVEQHDAEIDTLLNDELSSLMGMENWRLSNDIESKAYEIAFPDPEKRLEFMQNLKIFIDAKISAIGAINRKLPRDRKDPLFRQSQSFRKDKLDKVSGWTKMHLDRVIKDIDNTELEFGLNE
jgi:hypothetical protein